MHRDGERIRMDGVGIGQIAAGCGEVQDGGLHGDKN